MEIGPTTERVPKEPRVKMHLYATEHLVHLK